MKTPILVADDDPVAQRVLKTVLEHAGYEVRLYSEGITALNALLQPDAPHIAIVDWMMPGLDGIELCTRLRTTSPRIRPHVIMLTTKNDKTDLVEALDAGADDYLSKPFNQLELLARLRVAVRLVRCQLEIRRHIDELENLTQRHELLGEMAARNVAEAAAPEAPEESPAPPPAGHEPLDSLLLQTLNALDLGPVTVLPAGPRSHAPGSFAAWTGLILSRRQLSVDLLLDATPDAAAACYQATLRRPVTREEESLHFLAERLTLIRTTLRNTLQDQEGTVLTPRLTRSLRIDRTTPLLPEPAKAATLVHVFEFADHGVRLTATVQPSPLVWKIPGQLNPDDVSAEVFPPREVSSIPFLNQGVVLSARYIEKMMALADTELKGLKVPVFPPSPFAAYFSALDSRRWVAC